MQGREAGFTLIEVMVALLIAALATVILLRAGADGAAENRAAGNYEEALVRAQSRLASVGTLTPLREQSAAGADGGGFGWRLAIVRLQAEGPLALYDVVVSETFGGGRRVVLETESLGHVR